MTYAPNGSALETEGEYAAVWPKMYDDRLLDAYAAALEIHTRAEFPLRKHRWGLDGDGRLDDIKLAAAWLEEDRAWKLLKKVKRVYRAHLDEVLHRAEDKCEMAERQCYIAPPGLQKEVSFKIWQAAQRKLRKARGDHRRFLNEDYDLEYNYDFTHDFEQEWLEFHLLNPLDGYGMPEPMVDDPADVLSPHPMSVFLK